jgi:MFS family permease
MKNNKKNLLQQEVRNKKDIALFKVLVVLFLPYVALSIGQNGFLGLLHFVREEFDLTRVQVGYYSTSFFISAALLAVFTGSIVDKMVPKKGMLCGIGSMGILLLLHSLSASYNFLLLIAFFTGLGFSIITPSATKAVMINSPKEKRAVSMGFTQTGFYSRG